MSISYLSTGMNWPLHNRLPSLHQIWAWRQPTADLISVIPANKGRIAGEKQFKVIYEERICIICLPLPVTNLKTNSESDN